MTIPAGYKLVPVRPTPEMVKAATEFVESHILPHTFYAAMLAAAPSPPSGWLGNVSSPVDGRWYVCDQHGMMTLCANEADARKEAADGNLVWPRCAPYVVMQVGMLQPPEDRT